ncbi:DinB family protein [Pareuzebyella sediminis]|uniref:DinB family protein n=1 Tax=Pareuzebyella sediminis TaxID=2607998 RepID=UPI0011F02B15|nr:DinB family protein [Pareuzebyella sediminis]
MAYSSGNEEQYEVWLRGPLPDISSYLQPAAHALLQVREDLRKHTENFPDKLLWSEPCGRASIGFHLQHLTGVLDRMLAYDKERPLSKAQFAYLKKEGLSNEKLTTKQLVDSFDEKVEEAVDYFKTLPESILTEKRTVGRKKLPSTVIGLLFHAAEHAQRHFGQLLVTISVLKTDEAK